MKILHTADIHIQEFNDDRWQTFSKIIQIAKSEQIDVLAISGDLFDSDADANKLRPKFREFFSEKLFDVILIPGNHDQNAYPEGVFLGDRINIIQNPLQPVNIGDVSFWGFPFQELKSIEVLQQLQEMDTEINSDGNHILLFHGELLDISGAWENYGDEGQRRYLPVNLDSFRYLKWDYILAGHFHSNFDVRQIGESKYFVYPGSPVSITRRELGPRKINLFEVSKPPQPFQMDTRYYESLEIKLDPFVQLDIKNKISEGFKNLSNEARLLLKITGYFDRSKLGMTEFDLQKDIRDLVGERAEIQFEFRDIHEVLEDGLFQTFYSKLENTNLNDSEKQRVRELTLRAMMEL
jgi:DNA repair exonuclease SbcCD nuclease subunit